MRLAEPPSLDGSAAGEAAVKVLIVDDETVGRALLDNWVREWGYEVITASSGEECLALLEGDPSIQLVVLDWLMPGISGLDVCRRVRENPHGRYVYLILLTGKGDAEDAIVGLEAGADDYVKKPCNPKELQVRLNAGRRIIELERALTAARERLAHEAAHDALTGIWNRRAILDELRRELFRAARTEEPVSVVLGDVDNFKAINDNFGHGVGDDVLREVAHRVQKCLRSYDRAGRYGGEEFLVVLAGCGEEGGIAVAERIRQAVETEPIVCGKARLTVTLSLGVACSGHDASLDRLVRAADLALYRSKSGGRNRVTAALEADFVTSSR